jgi:imidazolonepropionase-like amidohydrolase
MDLLLSVGRVLSSPKDDPILDCAILIRDEIITAIGPRSDVAALASPDATRLDYPSSTALPGLINAHVHLAFDAGPDPITTLASSDDDSLLTGMATRARCLLRAGVTTTRDLGDVGGLAARLRDEINAGRQHGPRILAATVPLTIPGGHCHFLGGEVDGENEIRAMVRRNASRGADLIKLMATGGQLTPTGPAMWESQFSAAELCAAVDEAHRLGLPVAAHAHGTDGIAAAVAAGVDTIEHCTWLTEGFRSDPREDIATQIVARGISVCIGLGPGWRAFAQRLGPERAETMFNRLRWMRDQGIRLIIGTDAGLPGSAFNDFVSALELYEYLGFTRSQILEMATTGAASALGLSGRTGRLAIGYDADLIVVDGDPVAELNALRKLQMTVARGRTSFFNPNR